MKYDTNKLAKTLSNLAEPISWHGFLRVYNEMVAKLFLLQFYLFGCVIIRLRKMLFAVAGLRPQNILLVFLASLENLKFRYEIVLQPSQYLNN